VVRQESKCYELLLNPRIPRLYDSYAYQVEEASLLFHAGYNDQSVLATLLLIRSYYILMLNKQFDSRRGADLDDTKVGIPSWEGLPTEE
jgi:hypothetical protein